MGHFLLTLCFLPFALGATKRTALVKIQNDTPDPISAASISHKYSDVYKNHYDWPVIQPGELSSDAMTVEYNTGWLTTGRDWWLLMYHHDTESAVRPNEIEMRYTSPNNFRGIIDFLEQSGPTLITKAIDAVKGANPELLPAAEVAKIATSELSKVLLNSESTVGFKQHILRSEDEGAVTVVVINADDTVTFKSNSGNSDTVTSSKWVEAEHA